MERDENVYSGWMSKLLRRTWTIFANILAITSLASCADQFVVWISFLQEFIEFYRSIIDPIFSFIFNWLSFDVPRWVNDYCTFGAVIIFGPFIRSSKITPVWKNPFFLWNIGKSSENYKTPKLLKRYGFVILHFTITLTVGFVFLLFLMFGNALLYLVWYLIFVSVWPVWIIVHIWLAVAGKSLRDWRIHKAMLFEILAAPLLFILLLLMNFVALKFTGYA